MPPLRRSLDHKKPKITYDAKHEIGKLLDVADSNDWRKFASKLDQKIFTHDWILLTETKCRPTGKSPTEMVLKRWEESFLIHQSIPVDNIIGVLNSMGRNRVASVVETMLSDGTFFDFEDTDEHYATEEQASGGFLSGRPSQAQPVGSRERYSEAETRFHCRQSPQQDSFTGWQSSDMAGQRAGPSPPAFPSFETQPPITNFSDGRPPYMCSPHNLKKSNYSLHTDGSCCSPQQPRHDDGWKTWPRGHKANQGEENVCRPTPDTSFIHLSRHTPSAFTHIDPLMSFAPVCTNHVARASPVQDISFFITYGYRSYKVAMEMGMALKARGHNVMVDTKNSEAAKQLFKTSTYVVVLYNRDYLTEVMENEQSPLNTKFIFDLMVEEFRKRKGDNVRFVPIINSTEVGEEHITPILRRYPVEQARYVCEALRAFKAPVRNEVSIQRTVYSLGGK